MPDIADVCARVERMHKELSTLYDAWADEEPQKIAQHLAAIRTGVNALLQILRTRQEFPLKIKRGTV